MPNKTDDPRQPEQPKKLPEFMYDHTPYELDRLAPWLLSSRAALAVPPAFRGKLAWPEKPDLLGKAHKTLCYPIQRIKSKSGTVAFMPHDAEGVIRATLPDNSPSISSNRPKPAHGRSFLIGGSDSAAEAAAHRQADLRTA